MNKEEFPLVSFFIVAYKEEKYIREAIQGAFNQDYPNLEIILSDDNSPDNTFEIMKEMVASYNGPHKVILNQNVPNLGPRDHYCKVLYELCHGDIIVFADGDDISDPQRTSVTVDFFNKHPDVVSLSFESCHIDEDGNQIVNRFSNHLSENDYSIYTLDDFVRYPLYNLSDDSRAVRRSLVDSFPPLKYSYAEDVFLFVRSMYLGSYGYIRKPLVAYRQRKDSIMGKSRSQLFVRKKEVEFFESTTEKQFWEDYKYAVQKGYIPVNSVDSVKMKIIKSIKNLSPKRKFTINRIARRVSWFIDNHFDI